MEQNLEKYNKILINSLLKKGKKNSSEKIFQNLLVDIKYNLKQNPNKILYNIIKKKLSPKIFLITVPFKRKKKKNFLICLNDILQFKKGIKFLLKNTTIKTRLNEIIKINKNRSKLLKLKKNYYKSILKTRFNMKY